MSYKALYRKYRPKSFDDVKGQDHIVQTLKNIINSRKISHAYLFSGPRGVGKTSVAKIFASLINCYHNADDFSHLCKMCEEQINNNIDIIEMDAASNNGVDSIRELREKIQHLPAMGNYKVYIIDEVHMLSKGAFNALLKTLEEPPAHAVFILATTDPQKIPTTILSRVQRFNFRKISTGVLIQQLREVLQKENIKYEEATLGYIARLATGGMRDALSIVDQANAYGNGELKLEDVMYSFGITSNESLINLINFLYEGKTKEALVLFTNLKNAGIDYRQFVNGLIDLVKDYLIYNKTKDIKSIEMLSVDEINLLRINIDYALKVYEQLYKLEKDLYYTENAFQLIELFLIKIANSVEETQPKVQLQINIDTKEVAMPEDKKQVSTGETKLNNIINETKQAVFEANVDNVINETIENSILTGEFDSAIVLDEDVLIDSREIELMDDDEQTPSKLITLVEPYDNKYKKMTSFVPKYSDDTIIQLLLRSDLGVINSYKSSLNYLKAAPKEDYKGLIEALSACTIKAANTNFILFTSRDLGALNYLQNNENKGNVQKFLSDYFGSYKNLVLLETDYFKKLANGLAKRLEDGTQSANVLNKDFVLEPVKIEKEKNATQQLFDLLNGETK
ncbi:DNA polymerase III subunit gamma/tau [Mycoplasmopsis adleri]|uniref:DNA polymerase III subunit gamma/tau n=1 Tax=Mycoplasmopsis adleri TaxID=51362 RepID=UPI003873C364